MQNVEDQNEDTSLRSRRFVFTLNNYNDASVEWWKTAVDRGVCTYVMFSQEIGESLTPHLQGYFEVKERISIKAFRVKPDHGGGVEWYAVAKGTCEQSKTYTSKGNNPTWVDFGKPSSMGRGARSDLHQVADLIVAGGSIKDVITEHPVEYMKYHGGISKLLCFHSPPRNFLTKVLWVHGSAGSGKSMSVRMMFPNGYGKMTQNKWWDGYMGQEVVILDDWRPNKEMNFSYMLTLMDRYPMKIESKNGVSEFSSKLLIITCPHHPDILLSENAFEWIGLEERFQFTRRIGATLEFKRDPRWGRHKHEIIRRRKERIQEAIDSIVEDEWDIPDEVSDMGEDCDF